MDRLEMILTMMMIALGFLGILTIITGIVASAVVLVVKVIWKEKSDGI